MQVCTKPLVRNLKGVFAVVPLLLIGGLFEVQQGVIVWAVCKQMVGRQHVEVGQLCCGELQPFGGDICSVAT